MHRKSEDARIDFFLACRVDGEEPRNAEAETSGEHGQRHGREGHLPAHVPRRALGNTRVVVGQVMGLTPFVEQAQRGATSGATTVRTASRLCQRDNAQSVKILGPALSAGRSGRARLGVAHRHRPEADMNIAILDDDQDTIRTHRCFRAPAAR
jgi:hypothetical protein